jgi:hypothetical protein
VNTEHCFMSQRVPGHQPRAAQNPFQPRDDRARRRAECDGSGGRRSGDL